MENRTQSLHVGLIMDGNGRWATRRGLPREAGHHAGVSTLRDVTEAAAQRGIGTLTVYAFSSDNWKRPKPEVAAIMGILAEYLLGELARLVRANVRLTMIGRRDRLDASLVGLVRHVEKVTSQCDGLALRVALDYSGREAIVAAARACTADLTSAALSAELAQGHAAPDVDLLIRTGGEQRLSDFMLWEAAYAELYFTEVCWPDFGAEDLDLALASFARRERRIGGLPEPQPRPAPAQADTDPPRQHRPRRGLMRALFEGRSPVHEA